MTQPVDPLLRDALLARTPEDGSARCLDADLLAAWFEGSMTADDRRSAEAHVADCARCQMLVAAMARTVPPDVPRPWWRTPSMRWVAPLTAAVASAVVWVNLSDRATAPQRSPAALAPDGQEQQKAAAAPVSPPPAPEAVRIDVTPRAQAQSADSSKLVGGDLRQREFEPVGKAEQGKRGQAAALPALPAPKVESLQDSAIPGAAPIPPEPAAEARAADSVPRFTAASAPSAPSARSAPPPPAAGRGGAQAPVQGVAETAIPAQLLRDGQVSERARQIAIQSAADPRVRWRILGLRSVQRSTDGGTRWETQSTGLNATLNAGSSPSANVCWIVGAEGVVVLSTDGRSWRRVAFPERADLIAVSATDERSAVVTTNDGRRFTTTDSGKTWVRQ